MMKFRKHLSATAAMAIAVSLFAGCENVAPLAPSTSDAPQYGKVSPHDVAAPSNVNAAAMSASRIDIGWQDNSDETSFEVYRSTTGAAGPFTLLATTASNVVIYTDEGLQQLTEYCYQVRAVNVVRTKTNRSAFSSTACATTFLSPTEPPPPSPSAPAAPSGANVVPYGSNSLKFEWRDNSDNEDGFRVYRSIDGGTSWVYYAGTGPNEVAIHDDLWQQGENPVCYFVTAYVGTSYSAPSNTACVSLVATPYPLNSSWVDAETVELTWNDNSGIEDGYQVWLWRDYQCQQMECTPEEDAIDRGPWLVAELPANTTSYRTAGMTETTYYFYVVAIKGNYSSGASNLTSAAP